MSLRTRVALWTFVTALLAAASLTALHVWDAARAAHAALSAEGRRIAVSAVTLADVLRLTGDDADRATLQSYLRAAVKGSAGQDPSADQLAFALVVDESGELVAGEVAPAVLDMPGAADPVSAVVAAQSLPSHLVVIDADVLARDVEPDLQKKIPDQKVGRVLVGLSARPAMTAAITSALVSSAVSAFTAFGFAALLFAYLGRRVVRPQLDEKEVELAEKESDNARLKSALSRHVGVKLADEIADIPVGAGRRMMVSALFLDVESFGTRMARTSPEEVVAFLQELMAACVEVVHAHDGHVARLMGDTLLAAWGMPLARPDDALNATRAALALQKRCQELSDAQRARGGEPFTVGVGVATGEAVVANVGSADRAETVLVGEVITLARRVEEQAKSLGFGVLVSSETFGRVDQVFEGAATPPILVKGIGTPLVLFRVRPRARGA
jgi:class 3 adenylate cyclase